MSIGAWTADRLSASDLPWYIVAQVLGGIAGAGILVLTLNDKNAGYDVAVVGLGQNGWGEGYLGRYSTTVAILTELVATFIFVSVILAATASNDVGAMAGLVIALTAALCIVLLQQDMN